MVSKDSSDKKLEPPSVGESETYQKNDSLDIIENKYKVLKEIGKGKTSTVYLVNHLFLNNQLAIKLFRDKYWENERRFTRAQREAQILASINHENVVKVFDFGVTGDGAPYIVQEYVSGTNLKEFVSMNGAVKEIRALKLIIQIANGLNCLHENRILHRDIKSQNVIINEEDQLTNKRIKLIDLGIARPDETDGAIQSLTQSGTHVGSPYYMSPENCKGNEIDNRSDIYSLGCVMYEILSGKLPFRADSALKTLEMHINDEPGSLTDYGVSEKLNEIVQKCLAKEKESRYPNCKILISDLDTLLNTSNTSKPRFPVLKPIALPLLVLLLVGLLVEAKLKTNPINLTDSSLGRKIKPSPKLQESKVDTYIQETTRANLLSRLRVRTKAVKLYKKALQTAFANNASDIEKCMIAEEYTNGLMRAENLNAVDNVYSQVDKSLESILKRVKDDPNYSKKLGSVPLLCQSASLAALSQKDYFAAEHRIDNGIKLLIKHPDSDVLTPYFNITKAKCMTKTKGTKEALALVNESKRKLATLLGKQHFLYINALVTEGRIYEMEKNYVLALKSFDDALMRCRHSRTSINTDFIIIRKREISKKLKESQAKD